MKFSLIFRFIVLAIFLCSATSVNEAEWQRNYERSNVTIYHRSAETLRYDQFKVEAMLNADLDALHHTLETTEALPVWFPLCNHAELIEEDGNRRIIYMTFNFPFPFKNRDAYLEIVRTEVDGKHAFAMKGIDRPEHKRFVRVESVESITELTLNGDQVDVDQITYLDPGGSIPKLFMKEGLPPALNSSLNALEKLSNITYSISTNPAQ